jgi:hypothetical protein
LPPFPQLLRRVQLFMVWLVATFIGKGLVRICKLAECWIKTKISRGRGIDPAFTVSCVIAAGSARSSWIIVRAGVTSCCA